LIFADRGDVTGATAGITEALQLVEGSGHAVEGSLLALRAMISLLGGDFEQAKSSGEAALAVADRVHGLYVHTMAEIFSGYARYKLERDAGAVAQLGRAVSLLEGRRIGLFLSFVLALYADASLQAGEDERARHYALAALARAEAGDPMGQIAAYRVLAQLAQQQSPELAVQLLTTAQKHALARRSTREQQLTAAMLAQVQRSRDPGPAEPQT
jgi:hypothetical protein